MADSAARETTAPEMGGPTARAGLTRRGETMREGFSRLLKSVSRTTSPTLLDRLKDMNDQAAWDRFYAMYSPLVIGFVRQRGGSVDLAFDVLQETMVCLLRVLPSFRYNPRTGRFRSFLMRIVDSRFKDALRRAQRYEPIADGTHAAGWVDRIPDGGKEPLGVVWDRLWDHNLLLLALEKVRRRVNRQTYRSFEMNVLEEAPVATIQSELGLSANVVHQHRARVLKMVKREMERMKVEVGE